MDGGLTITLISVAMFVGCFALGFIPLLFRLSEKSLQFVSILGAGLLCGTALAITIPEGVGLLEESWRGELGIHTRNTTLPSCIYFGPPSKPLSLKGPAPQFLIGLALTFGFTFMFVVDQIGNYLSTRGKPLIIQNVCVCVADGFAVGAAVATGQVTVQVIVFVAVILHKAPAAFGLVSFLMHAGLEKKYIQGHLLAFSAAAPILAVTTYFILHASGPSAQSQFSATGVGMLFSAGTFLYVATVHVLPEVSSSRTGQAEGPHQQQLGLLESLTLILGVGLPMVLALGLHAD
uniref:Zinc transporter ZIP9 n=1 Tax=Cyclopterus lumpus TaxID=8103 RepID=A0A8C2ZGV7_CYCLU